MIKGCKLKTINGYKYWIAKHKDFYSIYYRPFWFMPFYLIGKEDTMEEAQSFVEKHRLRKKRKKKKDDDNI